MVRRGDDNAEESELQVARTTYLCLDAQQMKMLLRGCCWCCCCCCCLRCCCCCCWPLTRMYDRWHWQLYPAPWQSGPSSWTTTRRRPRGWRMPRRSRRIPWSRRRRPTSSRCPARSGRRWRRGSCCCCCGCWPDRTDAHCWWCTEHLHHCSACSWAGGVAAVQDVAPVVAAVVAAVGVAVGGELLFQVSKTACNTLHWRCCPVEIVTLQQLQGIGFNGT